ncbi:hypothetical protein [Streptomyces sp. HUAS CX7]|uniref:hypothetical protein n=1 Tax=Streptomyces sp. HUAS CX7 TaxID=3062782 RepID=UPI0026EB7D2F|nr:hypothetical protein [Streptomyces sp. HUAS CX7]WKX19352.1 hypothetical protein Q3Y68_15380 [Streptomyces sp. HUAS CX7]
MDVGTDRAKDIFDLAAVDLAFLAIPQIVANHIELMVGTIEECEHFVGLVKPHKSGWPASRWQVPLLRKAIRFGEPPTTADQLIEFSVQLRNTIMHGAGRVDDDLVKAWNKLTPVSKQRWESLAGRPFTYARMNSRPSLSWGEIQATLAVTKESASEITTRVQRVITRPQWAEIVARDYRRVSPRRFFSSSPGKRVGKNEGTPRALLRLHSHAVTHYHPLGLTLDELGAARQRML